eukprot:Gb_23239 [translate_table: standard]
MAQEEFDKTMSLITGVVDYAEFMNVDLVIEAVGEDIARIMVQGKKEANTCYDIKNTLLQKGHHIPLVTDIHFPPIAIRVAEYDCQNKLEHIEEVFTPSVEKRKTYGRAMHIGTNHGSLSDRNQRYYGNSPRAWRNQRFRNVYRLLVSEMYIQGWNYPLYLGVTEASEGENGRMKSVIGIRTLLMDGLGDTIQISLTETPEE